MPINLTKGQKVDLTKGNPSLKNIMVGLGWDVNEFDSGYAFDLDAAAFMLGSNGKCPTEKEFIFYGNLQHNSESVIHMGDNLTGEGDGDDEQIKVDLAKIPANVDKIAFTVTIYDADVRKGRTYYYKVCAVQNDKGIITKASKMVSVKAK